MIAFGIVFGLYIMGHLSVVERVGWGILVAFLSRSVLRLQLWADAGGVWRATLLWAKASWCPRVLMSNATPFVANIPEWGLLGRACLCILNPVLHSIECLVFFLFLCFRVCRSILAIWLGLFLSGRRFKFVWHTISYWFYLAVAATQIAFWRLRSDSQQTVLVGLLLVAVLLNLTGWVKLAGDIEEKSKIVVFSFAHLAAMHEDGQGVLR